MKSKRTGNIVVSTLATILILIGRPLFHTALFLGYLLIFIAAHLYRLLIQLIKSLAKTWLYVKRVIKTVLLSFLHWLSLLIKKHRVTLETPIKQLVVLPRIRIPSIKISKKKRFIVTPLILTSLLLTTIIFFVILKDLPNPNGLKTRDQIVSTKILDRNGTLLYKIFKNENRTPIKLEEIPPYMIEATIAIEDKDFYKHAGYSYSGIIRALRDTILKGQIQGGSTITQQLVKNALLTREKTITRKVKEIMLAILTEMKFTKDEILSMYFNEVGYGGAAYGIEEASQMYFNKSVKKLNLAESALLAGLPASPTKYSPFGTNPELAKFRQHEVLRRMVEDGYITAGKAEEAKAEKIAFAPRKTNIQAPHFVMYVKDLLVKQYGEQLVEQGGLEVTTSLDLNIQKLTQRVISYEINQLQNLNISNAASLTTNPATGEILAMVGSTDFFDFEHDGQVNVTIRPRQPGSAIKPINYAVALENGMTAVTILSDTPITYHIPGQPPYSPKNYDDKFHGNISLRLALANSYNVPAVKTLSVFGVDKMIEKGREMGITTWNDRSRFGLSLTLGGGEVKMTDLATAYGSLANGGFHVDLQPILEVKDYRGKVFQKYSCKQSSGFGTYIPQAQAIKEKTCNPKQVVKPEVAFILNSILSDNKARSQAFGSHSVLNIPEHQVAVKTGTTQNLRDNWTIGYTTNILVATWVGNNDNSPMSYVASGITGASPIWNKIMRTLLSNQEKHNFKKPENITEVDTCPITGTLACEGCPNRKEYFIKGTQPSTRCVLNLEEENLQPSQILQGVQIVRE